LFFVFAGAFTGIEEVVASRLNAGSATIGFSAQSNAVAAKDADSNELRAQITAQDIASYGIKRELVGRIGSIMSLSSLGEDALVEIIRKGKYSIEARMERCLPDGTLFEIERGAARLLAKRAIDAGLGARSIEPVVAGFVAKMLAECRANNYYGAMLDLNEEGELDLAYFDDEHLQGLGDLIANLERKIIAQKEVQDKEQGNTL
jgi:ATP-dependent Clp protease ATP-binding subunit ClpX